MPSSDYSNAQRKRLKGRPLAAIIRVINYCRAFDKTAAVIISSASTAHIANYANSVPLTTRDAACEFRQTRHRDKKHRLGLNKRVRINNVDGKIWASSKQSFPYGWATLICMRRMQVKLHHRYTLGLFIVRASPQ